MPDPALSFFLILMLASLLAGHAVGRRDERDGKLSFSLSSTLLLTLSTKKTNNKKHTCKKQISKPIGQNG
jgi:hypothetical protein